MEPKAARGLNDGAFRAEWAAGTDGERRRQRLENPTRMRILLLRSVRLPSLRECRGLEGRLPKVNHDPYQQAADRRNQDDPCAQMVCARGR